MAVNDFETSFDGNSRFANMSSSSTNQYHRRSYRMIRLFRGSELMSQKRSKKRCT